MSINARLQILKQVLTRKWYNDQRTPLDLATGDLRGQTVAITGSNVSMHAVTADITGGLTHATQRGIGSEAAKHFARMNLGRLILACRNMDAEKLAADKITEETECNVFGLLQQRRKTSYRYLRWRCRNHERNRTTEDEWEASLQINYLSNALLTMLLLPTISIDSISKTRIILVTSEAHSFISRLEEADNPELVSKLNESEHCSKQVDFGKDNLLTKSNLLVPTVVAVSPGFCSSDVDSEAPTSLLVRPTKRGRATFIASTPEMGSRTIIQAAVSDDAAIPHGKYLTNCRVEQESDYSRGEDGMIMQRRLWDETMHILKNVESGVETILQVF
ncbi:hypothetical protein C8F04DRAFT_1193816 [Mycena alexandri]|uniref:Uncharacterized protein n=1 Tax=Mycena alexandri TaxID=1745969 RepID=A0AAD6SCL5_9AGAR|nr:hypothetical protein C8F04DRAFT_1193816 [Mycena alexandri]